MSVIVSNNFMPKSSMTGTLVKIKHKFPSLWRFVERVNGIFMRLRYPDLPEKAKLAAASVPYHDHGLQWSLVTPDDADELSLFLNSIPAERLKHFNPHPFDSDTLRRIASNRSFVMFKVTGQKGIVGYHFLRYFFIGKAFHGLIVDSGYCGKGIGTAMWALGAEICHLTGVRMFATISEANLPSLASCRRGCSATIVKRINDGYLLISCRRADSGQ